MGVNSYDDLSIIDIDKEEAYKDYSQSTYGEEDYGNESRWMDGEESYANDCRWNNQEENYENASRWIYMSYSTTKVKISTTSRLIEFASFVGSVGGNLGLFVGFSFISMFFFVYEQLEKWFNKNLQI